MILQYKWCCFKGAVIFQFDSMQEVYLGTLTVVSAANLAAWVIGGFKTLASAFCKCQYKNLHKASAKRS